MKSFHRTTLIIIISLIIVVAGLFLGVIDPLMSRLSKIYQENLNANQQIAALEEKVRYLSDMEENQDEITKANQKFKDFVPKTQQVEDVLVQLDALARNSTNNLPSFSVTEEAKDKKEQKGDFKTTTIKIALKGTYETISNFINSLENLQRFAVIESLTIRASEDETSADITLTVYHYE